MKWYLILFVCLNSPCEKYPDIGWQAPSQTFVDFPSQIACKNFRDEARKYIRGIDRHIECIFM